MTNNKVTIIYDKECPFCKDFVYLSRLKQVGYNVELLNAREKENSVIKYVSKKYDLDYGMIVIVNGEVLYGHEAASFIIGKHSSLKIRGKLYSLLLRNKSISKLIYPFLVILRKIFFLLIGKKGINESK